MKKLIICAAAILMFSSVGHAAEYLGQYTTNKYASGAIQPGSPANRTIGNSMQNQYSAGGPKLYNSDGEYRGNLNGNRYDSNSVSNPYGRYGSKYSTDSINNPYGAGSKYRSDSPNNRYGQGMSVFNE